MRWLKQLSATDCPDHEGNVIIDGIVFDRVHPNHHGPNTVHMTRVQIAELVQRSGCRRVLDLPCGTGTLTRMLLDQGVEVVAADLDPGAFLVTGQKCVYADLNSTLPFEEKEFDALVCIEGIEHVENPHLVAREANRILRTGGKLYVSTPNVLSIRSRLSNLLRGYPDLFHYMIEIDVETNRERPIAHINPVGFLELRYALSRWGFQVEQVRTNRYLKKASPFYRLLRLLMLTRGKKPAASHPSVSAVRQALLSDEVLFGEALIIEATKVAAYQQVPGHD